MLLDLVHVTSAVDVGCGSGAWVSALHEHGVEAIGIDSPDMPTDDLRITETAFRRHDLREPLDLGERFDLALCLEVGEHLEERHARTLVLSLVRHAPVIVFSAAIPGQGGEGHVNEQWQSYWAALFAEQGYEAFDCLRVPLWQHPEVARWYAQNTIVYADATKRGVLPEHSSELPLDVVHPRLYARLVSSPPPRW